MEGESRDLQRNTLLSDELQPFSFTELTGLLGHSVDSHIWLWTFHCTFLSSTSCLYFIQLLLPTLKFLRCARSYYWFQQPRRPPPNNRRKTSIVLSTSTLSVAENPRYPQWIVHRPAVHPSTASTPVIRRPGSPSTKGTQRTDARRPTAPFALPYQTFQVFPVYLESRETRLSRLQVREECLLQHRPKTDCPHLRLPPANPYSVKSHLSPPRRSPPPLLRQACQGHFPRLPHQALQWVCRAVNRTPPHTPITPPHRQHHRQRKAEASVQAVYATSSLSKRSAKATTTSRPMVLHRMGVIAQILLLECALRHRAERV